MVLPASLSAKALPVIRLLGQDVYLNNDNGKFIFKTLDKDEKLHSCTKNYFFIKNYTP